MPALWKSILHKEKPSYGYSSNNKSQFEMMNTSQKGSRAATHNRGTISYKDEAEESDENNLLPDGRPHVTTSIRAGINRQSTAENGNNNNNNNRAKTSFDESQIIRTVEVRQYHEG